MGLSCRTDLPRFRCLMNSAMPPLYLKSARLASPVFGSVVRSSVSEIQQALIQKGQLAQPLRKRVIVVLGDRENCLVRKEVDLGTALPGIAGLLRVEVGNALANSPAPRAAVRARLQGRKVR